MRNAGDLSGRFVPLGGNRKDTDPQPRGLGQGQCAGRELHRIVIVGGGAGGLELATHLGDKLGRSGSAEVILVDKNRTHFWKPHLHEIAAGSMDLRTHELSYIAQGHWHGFMPRIGEMIGLDRDRRVIQLAPYIDETGESVAPMREISYDTLVLAVGSQTNDFGTPGAKENAISLDAPAEAEQFHRRLVNACIRAHSQSDPLRPDQLQVAIIGGGATGVELAAELRHAAGLLMQYGLDRADQTMLGINLIEAGPRILPALPQRLSDRALDRLRFLNVSVLTSARVSAVVARGVDLADGRHIPAELVVWAAGVKAPEFLKNLGGLESNHVNQLKVRATLQTTLDDNIFAIGDCAACEWVGHPRDLSVPPRAQAAHQQAAHLSKSLSRKLKGATVLPWRYRDFGSLVSLGRYSTVGNLMTSLSRRSFGLEGYFAWLMYVSLYQMHKRALHGSANVVLDLLARYLSQRTRPRVKLH